MDPKGTLTPSIEPAHNAQPGSLTPQPAHNAKPPQNGKVSRAQHIIDTFWKYEESQKPDEIAGNDDNIRENGNAYKYEPHWLGIRWLENTLLVVSPDGTLFLYDNDSETVCWSIPTRKAQLQQMTCLNWGKLFFCFTRVEYQDSDGRKLIIPETDRTEPHLKPIYKNPDALDLLTKLLKEKKERAKALEASNHTLFWSATKRVQFIQAVTERLEVRNSTIRHLINKIGIPVCGTDKDGNIKSWGNKLPPGFVNLMENTRDQNGNYYCKYSQNYAFDLLRIIKNLMSHEESIKHASKTDVVLNKFGINGYAEYIQQKIPNLANEVHNAMREAIEGQPKFLQYYRESP